jgi:hypothetical protein
MDCKTAQLLISCQGARGSELDASEAHALEQHLAFCPVCDALLRAERQFDERMRTAIHDVPTPAGLQERLLDHLAGARQDWYWKWAARSLRAVAAAAALFAIIYIGHLWWQPPLPSYPPERFCEEAAERRIAPPEAAQVEEWFRSRGVRTRMPDGFHFPLLVAYGLTNYLDQQVPQLIFINGPVHAQVYIISGNQIDLNNIPPRYESPSGDRWRVVILKQDGYAYVILHTGDSLKPFEPPDIAA